MIEVDFRAADTFLFAYITDISAMGIFIRTPAPEPPGTRLQLRFTPPPPASASLFREGNPSRTETASEVEAIECTGEVIWINPAPESYAGHAAGPRRRGPGPLWWRGVRGRLARNAAR